MSNEIFFTCRHHKHECDLYRVIDSHGISVGNFSARGALVDILQFEWRSFDYDQLTDMAVELGLGGMIGHLTFDKLISKIVHEWADQLSAYQRKHKFSVGEKVELVTGWSNSDQRSHQENTVYLSTANNGRYLVRRTNVDEYWVTPEYVQKPEG